MKAYSILTMNILSDHVYPFGIMSFSNRLPAILKMIQEYDPDILCFQEFTERMSEVSSYLEKSYEQVGSYRRSLSSDEAIMIFAKKSLFQITSVKTIWLSNTPNQPGSKFLLSQFPRIAVIATLKTKENQTLSVVSTHLDSNFEFIRFKQMKVLLHHIPSGPTILCGDFNTTINSKVFQLFSKEWNSQTIPESTLRGKFGSMRYHQQAIDHILAKDLELINTTNIKKDYEGRPASDHYPLLSFFQMKSQYLK